MPARVRPPRAGLPGATRCREAIDLTPGVVEETGADRDRFLAGLPEPEEKPPTQAIGVEIQNVADALKRKERRGVGASDPTEDLLELRTLVRSPGEGTFVEGLDGILQDGGKEAVLSIPPGRASQHSGELDRGHVVGIQSLDALVEAGFGPERECGLHAGWTNPPRNLFDLFGVCSSGAVMVPTPGDGDAGQALGGPEGSSWGTAAGIGGESRSSSVVESK